ncbi:MAG: family transcriptional regulator, regulator of embCAB operon [Mycobacteriales bacterium]
MVRFGILGPLEVQSAHHRFVPRGPKVRQVLALLLTRPNHVVDVDTFVEELWSTAPPRTVATTIRTHVYHLRQMLGQDGGVSGAAGLLLTEPAGYLLRVDAAEQLDAGRFTAAVEQGRRAAADGQPATAAGLLHAALAMWRGPALVNVPHGPVLAPYVTHLAELRMRALELRIEADLSLGRHRELVAELGGLVAAHPLNEWLHARLVDALHRSGRRGDALGAIRRLRRLLADELGLEPSAEIQRLQQEILTAPATLARRPAGLHIAS